MRFYFANFLYRYLELKTIDNQKTQKIVANDGSFEAMKNLINQRKR